MVSPETDEERELLGYLPLTGSSPFLTNLSCGLFWRRISAGNSNCLPDLALAPANGQTKEIKMVMKKNKNQRKLKKMKKNHKKNLEEKLKRSREDEEPKGTQ